MQYLVDVVIIILADPQTIDVGATITLIQPRTTLEI